MNIIRADKRGKGDHGWLQSRFSFSFADYYDPKRMGFGKLRVVNDDIVAGGHGFGAHPYSNMEIISIPTEGALAHKDSTGVEEVIHPGEVQVMSAGSGVTHSEYNHSDKDPVKFFQIWIETATQGIPPQHDSRAFTFPENELVEIVGPSALRINQDATLHRGKLAQGFEHELVVGEGRGAFIFVIEGSLGVDKEVLGKRDAAEVEHSCKLYAKEDTDALVIDVPM